MTLDEKLDILADYFAANRATNWTLGDESANCVREFGKGVVGKIAEVGRCTKERIRQLISVSVTFPKEKRYPEIDWTVYRAVINASKRLDRNPLEVLDYVLENEMSVAEIASLGIEEKKKVKISKTCGWCGSKITITADGGLVGEKVFCPVCLADNLGLHANEEAQKFILGALE